MEQDLVAMLVLHLFVWKHTPSLDGDQEPCIPSNALVDESFTVNRSAAFSNVIVFRKVSGNGPERITFGPNGGTYTSQIGSGAVYTRDKCKC